MSETTQDITLHLAEVGHLFNAPEIDDGLDERLRKALGSAKKDPYIFFASFAIKNLCGS